MIWVHGSGNVDRNGNQAGYNVKANYIKQFRDEVNEKGIAFLKGDSPLSVRKIDASVCNDDKECNLGENNSMSNANGNYTVVVDGQKFNVSIAEGNADIQVTPVASSNEAPAATAPVASNGEGVEVPAVVNGAVWKILVKVGDKVEKGDVVAILEAMKMEIDVEAPCSGTVTAVLANPSDAVEEGQAIATIG